MNGRDHHKAGVLEKEMITDSEILADVTSETSTIASALVDVSEAPKTDEHPQPETKEQVKSKGKKPIALILAGLGVSAIAAGTFGTTGNTPLPTRKQTTPLLQGTFTKLVIRFREPSVKCW